jgi:hypothetical protein
MTTGNQGIAVRSLAQRRSDVATAQPAIHQIHLAFKTTRDGGNATWSGATKLNGQRPRAFRADEQVLKVAVGYHRTSQLDRL